MLRTPSILGPLNSGFVPFASGAPVDALHDSESRAEAARVIARAAAPEGETLEHASRATWMPASSARILIVEGAVLAAICGYFGIGLLRTLIGF